MIDFYGSGGERSVDANGLWSVVVVGGEVQYSWLYDQRNVIVFGVDKDACTGFSEDGVFGECNGVSCLLKRFGFQGFRADGKGWSVVIYEC